MILHKTFAFLLILLLQFPLFAQKQDVVKLEQNMLLQILLDQAGYSPGEIDGKVGDKTLKALSTYQRANGLPLTGKADDRTLDLLSASGKPTLKNYRLTKEDVSGSITEVRASFTRKTNSPALRHASALKAVSAKFHLNPDLLRILNPQATLVAGEIIVVPNVLSRSAPRAPIKRVGGRVNPAQDRKY
jgi:peptidoglycan hydrolase-like protein with peptidoglycan-binding domain